MEYHIIDFSSETYAQVCFNFCKVVLWVDPYKVCENLGATSIFQGIMGNFGQFFKKKLLENQTRKHSYLVWRDPVYIIVIPTAPNLCTEAVIDCAMRTWMLAH